MYNIAAKININSRKLKIYLWFIFLWGGHIPSYTFLHSSYGLVNRILLAAHRLQHAHTDTYTLRYNDTHANNI